MTSDRTATNHNRVFAVVPAAGHSRRMGRPKLLLTVGNSTVISRMLDTLDRSEITATIVVVRANDRKLCLELESTSATVVQPVPEPAEMRDSVASAIDYLRTRFVPIPSEGWLLVPADYPLLNRGVLDALLDRWAQGDCRILIPTYHGKRGHPIVLRWDLADAVDRIPVDHGLNWLIQEHSADVSELAIDDAAIVADIDTPADYQSLLRKLEG